MARHWTDRISKYLGKPRVWYICVFHDSHLPATRINPYSARAHVGAIWLADNFPFSYAGFLADVIRRGRIGEFHNQGMIGLSQYDPEVAKPKRVAFKEEVG